MHETPEPRNRQHREAGGRQGRKSVRGGLNIEDLTEAWLTLEGSLRQLRRVIDRTEPKVMRYHQANLSNVDEQLVCLVTGMKEARFQVRQLSHLMEDWLHRCWIPELPADAEPMLPNLGFVGNVNNSHSCGEP